VQLKKEYIVTLILGNHEEKFFRCLHHLSVGTGIERQMKGIEEFPTFMTELTKVIVFLIGLYFCGYPMI
jgi:hypothetical protein